MKFLTWNLENFFLSPDCLGLHNSLKDPGKIQSIADIIKSEEPDILFLTEVGGRESLEIFNKKHLESAYEISFMPTNSNRGIDMGFLLSRQFLKSRKLEFRQFTHVKEPINFVYPHDVAKNKSLVMKGKKPTQKSEKLSRDLAELYLIDQESRTPYLILLGVHLKSKLDKEGIDWHGSRRRRAECLYVINHFKELAKRYHLDSIPIFLTGDFNGEAHKTKCEPELAEVYKDTDLIDFTDALNLERQDCYSFTGFDKDKKNFGLQLDYFFLQKQWSSFLIKKSSGVLRYKNPEGGVYPLPQTPGARHALPSDHYPLIIEFNDWRA